VWRSFGLNHTLTETRNQGSSRTTALSYHETLSQASFLYATLQRSVDDVNARPNTSLFVGWLYRFGGKFTASVNASKDETGQQTINTQVAKDIPQGEGLGYRVGWTGNQPQNTDRLNGFAQWNLPAISLSIDSYTLPAQGSSADYRELAAAGSIAFAGNSWGTSRQITDSFAIVQMGAKVPGVRVMANSQEIGVSNSSGQVISPFVGSFYESRISVDDKDVPLEYVMNKDFYTVTPAYRSGVSVNFGLRRVHGLEGVVRLDSSFGSALSDGKLVTLTQGGEVLQEFQIGRDGHFYIENIAPGDYRGEMIVAERNCHFALRFSDTQDIVFTLPGELVCE
jgi:outer membrane usher protein